MKHTGAWAVTVNSSTSCFLWWYYSLCQRTETWIGQGEATWSYIYWYEVQNIVAQRHTQSVTWSGIVGEKRKWFNHNFKRRIYWRSVHIYRVQCVCACTHACVCVLLCVYLCVCMGEGGHTHVCVCVRERRTDRQTEGMWGGGEGERERERERKRERENSNWEECCIVFKYFRDRSMSWTDCMLVIFLKVSSHTLILKFFSSLMWSTWFKQSCCSCLLNNF